MASWAGGGARQATTVLSYDTLTELLADPPTSYPSGTMAAVIEASELGQTQIAITNGTSWVFPYAAPSPTISWVADLSTPEDLIVPSGGDAVIGTGWSLAAQTIVRPSGVHSGAPGAAQVDLGAGAGGLWRFVAQLNYDSPAPGSGMLLQHFLQYDDGGGGGFVDVIELARLAQDAPAAISGISQVGLAINLILVGSGSLRVVARHDLGVSHTVTYNAYLVAMNLLAGTPT